MNRFLRSRLLRSLIPYFILGLMLIIAFRLSTELAFFTGHVSRFLGIFSPFAIGAVIAYILNLPCTALQKLLLKIKKPFVQKHNRALGIAGLVISIIALFAFILNMIIPAVGRSVVQFYEELATYEETVRTWIAHLGEWDLPEFLPDVNQVFDYVEEWLINFINSLNWENIINWLISMFGNVATALFQTFIAIVTAIYILIEKDKLQKFITKMLESVLKAETNRTVLKYSRKLNYNFHRYIATQTIDGLILGSMMTIWLLIIGSPYALILGLMLGIVNYIPYFGSIFGTVFAVIVIAFSQGLGVAGVSAIVMLVIQQIDGNIIQPRLMGGSFSISPLLIIISVTVGNAYAGIFGMLVAIPIVAILKDLLDEFIAYRVRKKVENENNPNNDFMDLGI